VNTLPRRIRATSSIRARFLAVILVGAVVPLALIGVWLTRSAARAGEDLLRGQLDESVQRIADAVAQRWSFRSGDLGLLANNDVAQRLVADSSHASLSAADSAWLIQVTNEMAPAFPSFEYRDRAGNVRWATPARAPDTSSVRGQRGASPASPTLTIMRQVSASPGAAELGTVTVHVSVAALISTDTSFSLPNGAKLQVIQRDTHLAVLRAFAPDSLLSRDRFAVGGVAWIAAHRSLADPAIDLDLAAASAPYTRPFEHSARTGNIVLAIVSLVVLLLAALLTVRLTGSLERLAVAADAVAAGDLEHRVDASGSDEVGRVGVAFNSMIDNLRHTLDELSRRQALAAVGEYAASLSHEVRNGLTAVRVDLQRAEEKTPGEAPGRPLIGRALENVKRLEGTVTASLRVARGSRTPGRRIELLPVLRSAIQGAEGAFGERGASIRPLPLAAAPAWILGDAMALEQLFLNLLLNAAQAVAPGGHAAVLVDADGADLLVIVTDTGSGISADHLQQVLDPFFSTKEDGAGLGLSVARQIAAAHGGSLRIDSTIGVGTRVEVRLPLASAPG
jgi:signal transduction histidine kinase